MANSVVMCVFVIFKFLNLGRIVGRHILRCTETSDESLTESKNAARSAVKLFWEAARSLDIPLKLRKPMLWGY